MFVISSAFYYSTAAAENSAQYWVTHSLVVRNSIERIRTDVIDGETGIRGFLVTRDATFLAPMNEANKVIASDVGALAALEEHNPLQEARVSKLRSLLSGGYQFSTTGLPSSNDPVAIANWLREQKSSTDSIRAVLSTMEGTANQLLNQRQRAAAHARAVANVVVGMTLGSGLLLGLLLTIAFTRSLSRRLRRLLHDAERLHEGAPLQEADTSADELGFLSRQFHEAATTQLDLQRAAMEERAAAQAASEEKSRFLSRMSHELRTPLNAVLGFAQILELDANQEQSESLAQIRRAGRHLLDLINEVLDISRIEAGALTLSAEPVNVKEMVEEVISLLGPMADAQGVKMLFGECQLFVHADRQRVRQVMLNLASNAVKYNRTGGAVDFVCSPIGDSQVRIDVIDTGIGISEFDLARLFTPFERFSAAEGDIEGSGIGLVLSRHLVHAMGGELVVASDYGKGSTFSVVLPRADEVVIAPTQPTSLASPSSEEGRHSSSLLYIEDNVSNVRLLEKILQRRPSWEMTHAGHGRFGIELATTRHYDLVLLDLHLPDMEGAEVLGHLRTSLLEVPVVVISADATPGQIQRLLAAGASAYLTKPIDVEEVLNLLDDTARKLDSEVV